MEMMVLNCPKCGASMDLTQGGRILVCKYCESTISVSQNPTQQRIEAFNRGNAHKAAGRFDEAKSVFEHIVLEDPADAEAHWQCALCSYCIKYASDPATGELIPTCLKIEDEDFEENYDYKEALKYASDEAKNYYEKEAKKIKKVIEGIKNNIQSIPPFDVFLSFKQTDENGENTKDSERAYEIYDNLTDKGYRVFYSPITLRDYVGSEYEPIIYRALQTAKIMFVIGSKKEYFEAEWVKNEWERFLIIKKNNPDREIVPCYFDMDAYNLPDKLSRLQGVNMDKIGYRQDIIEITKKIITEKNVTSNSFSYQQTAPVQAVSKTAKYDELIFQARKSIEQKNYSGAIGYLSEAQRLKPDSFETHYYRLLCNCNVSNLDSLAKVYKGNLYNDAIFKKCLETADEKQKTELNETAEKVKKKKKKKVIFTVAVVGAIGLIIICSILVSALYIGVIKPAKQYNNAKQLLANGDYETAYTILNNLGKEEEVKQNKYERAKALLESNDFDGAYALLDELGNYQDAGELYNENRYNRALDYLKAGDYKNAIELFNTVTDYKDAKEKGEEARRNYLPNALEAGDYLTAYRLYEELGETTEAQALADEYKWVQIAVANPGDTVLLGKYEQDNDASDGKEDVEWIVLSVQENKALLVTKNYIEKLQYDTGGGSSTNWEICSLRTWLNETMYPELFSEEEAERVCLSSVSATTNAPEEYGRHNGGDTKDYMFLLSYDEYYQYQTILPNSDFTTYAMQKKVDNIYVVLENSYWLRTMYAGGNPYYVSSTNGDSPMRITTWGCECNAGIRPAVWFDLSASAPEITE